MAEPFHSGGLSPEVLAIASAAIGKSPAGVRIRRVGAALSGATGQSARDGLGIWIAQFVPAEMLVPDVYKRWRPVVRDAIQFLFSRLSTERLAAKIVEQVDLPIDTPGPARLLRLISKMPGIQKVGQVLARHHRLDEEVRKALSELENGMSDSAPRAIRAILSRQLGARLRTYAVRFETRIFSEASVSAVIRFTWRNPEAKLREHGVCKVLKPYVREYFREDLSLLQHLSEFLAHGRGYGFATRHIAEMVSEVRLLLEHELDFTREQATLSDAAGTYRISPGVRVPRLIAPLSTPEITAMSEESGTKITGVFPERRYLRRRVAEQLVEALVAVPLLSRDSEVVFHADPHAGNLLYDERTGSIALLDWALTERLSRELRRQIALLVIMTVLRNAGAVSQTLQRLASAPDRHDPGKIQIIRRRVEQFFHDLPYNRAAGSLDAMQLLDEIALEGVHFPAALAMFQKALFTLDGVLRDIAGSEVSISYLIVRDFAIRLMVSFGLDHPPLSAADLVAVQRSGLLYPTRWGASALRGLASKSASEANGPAALESSS